MPGRGDCAVISTETPGAVGTFEAKSCGVTYNYICERKCATVEGATTV